MNDRAIVGHRFGFIRLKLTHEMPGEWDSFELSVFRDSFLMAVFPHMLHTRLG